MKLAFICSLFVPFVLPTSFNSDSAVILSANVWDAENYTVQVDSLTPGQQYRVYASQSIHISTSDYPGNIVIEGADGAQFTVASIAQPKPDTGYILSETNIVTAPITISDTTKPGKYDRPMPFVIYIVSTKIPISPVVSVVLTDGNIDSSIAKLSAPSCTVLSTAIRMELSEIETTSTGSIEVKVAGYDALSPDYTVLTVRKDAVGSKLTIEGPIATIHNPNETPTNFTFFLIQNIGWYGNLSPGASTAFLSQGWLNVNESYDSNNPHDLAPFTRDYMFAKKTGVSFTSVFGNYFAPDDSCEIRCATENGMTTPYDCAPSMEIDQIFPHFCTSITLSVHYEGSKDGPRFMIQVETGDNIVPTTTTRTTTPSTSNTSGSSTTTRTTTSSSSTTPGSSSTTTESITSPTTSATNGHLTANFVLLFAIYCTLHIGW